MSSISEIITINILIKNTHFKKIEAGMKRFWERLEFGPDMQSQSSAHTSRWAQLERSESFVLGVKAGVLVLVCVLQCGCVILSNSSMNHPTVQVLSSGLFTSPQEVLEELLSSQLRRTRDKVYFKTQTEEGSMLTKEKKTGCQHFKTNRFHG